MTGKAKLALGFAMLLISGVCVIGLWGGPEPTVKTAKVKFSQALLESKGSLKVDYDYTTSSGTTLHESDFINETKTAESFGGGSSSPSGSSYHIAIADVPSPPPSMLVITGKTYYLKLNGHLTIYHFTNTSGKTYRGELSLERQ